MVEVKRLSSHSTARCEHCGRWNNNDIWVCDAVINGRACRVVYFRETAHFQYRDEEKKMWARKPINELWDKSPDCEEDYRSKNWWRVEVHYWGGEIEYYDLPGDAVGRWTSRDPRTHNRSMEKDVEDMLQWC